MGGLLNRGLLNGWIIKWVVYQMGGLLNGWIIKWVDY